MATRRRSSMRSLQPPGVPVLSPADSLLATGQ
jgi:hypothetical protein